MSVVVCSLVGSLMGDAWMKLPALIDLCGKHEVRVVAGTYAMPVWEWGKKYLRGADYEMIETVEDPDDVESPYCPGKGYIALTAGLENVKGMYPQEMVLGDAEIGSYYYKQDKLNLELQNGLSAVDGEHTAVHAYTRHEWKNCNGVVAAVKYRRPVAWVGLPGEPTVPGATMARKTFDNMAGVVVQGYGFVGVLSSWFNLALLFRKRIVVASFTGDVPTDNPRCTKLVEPGVMELQAAIDAGGF